MRFNTPKKPLKINVATNESGGAVFEHTPKQKLINFMFNNKFQGDNFKDGDALMKEYEKLIDEFVVTDPLFLAKCAVYTRHIIGMRSTPQVAAAHIAKRVHNKIWLRNFFNAVTYRPDDALEIMGYYMNKFGKRPIANSLKKGIADAIGKFDAYQLAKYKKSESALSLRDLVRIVHPVPTSRNYEALKQLIDGTLKQEATVQTMLSTAGQKETKRETEKARSEAWETLINENRLGYAALVTNFINIMEESKSDVQDKAIALLTNKSALRNSNVYPLTLYILYRLLESSRFKSNHYATNTKALTAVADALEMSFENIPNFKGKRILVAHDVSGSMHNSVVTKHGEGRHAVEVENKISTLATMFSMAMVKSNNDVTYVTFGERVRPIMVNKRDSLLTLIKQHDKAPDGCTNFDHIFEFMRRANKYDAVIILSDMQAWGHYSFSPNWIKDYNRLTGEQLAVFTWDLKTNGTTVFPDNQVCAMAGFNPAIFDIMAKMLRDKDAIIKEIEAIKFEDYIKKFPTHKTPKAVKEVSDKLPPKPKMVASAK